MKNLSKEALLCYAAADYLEENGWCRGLMHGRGHATCLLGALSMVMPQHLPEEAMAPLMERVLAALGFRSPLGYYEALTLAADWNDTPGRTRRQVLRRLRSGW